MSRTFEQVQTNSAQCELIPFGYEAVIYIAPAKTHTLSAGAPGRGGSHTLPYVFSTELLLHGFVNLIAFGCLLHITHALFWKGSFFTTVE